jgi:hypothetical protein
MPPPNGELEPPPPPPDHNHEIRSQNDPMNRGEKPDPAEMEAHHAKIQAELFARFDKNQDGQLQFDEMKFLPHMGLPPPPPDGEFDRSKSSASEIGDEVSLGTASSAANMQPTDFCMEQNYPNPFNTLTTISYQLPMDAHVTLAVYNVAGELVKTLVDGYQPASSYQVSMEFSDQTSGQYFCRLQAGALSDVIMMSYIK